MKSPLLPGLGLGPGMEDVAILKLLFCTTLDTRVSLTHDGVLCWPYGTGVSSNNTVITLIWVIRLNVGLFYIIYYTTDILYDVFT